MLSERVRKAKGGVPFAKVLGRDKTGRVTKVVAPGSGGKQYMVLLRRELGGLTIECLLDTPGGDLGCKGNANGTVCYHGLMAVMAATADAGMAARFCRRWEDAERVSRTMPSSVIVRIHSRQGKGEIYAVVAA